MISAPTESSSRGPNRSTSTPCHGERNVWTTIRIENVICSSGSVDAESGGQRLGEQRPDVLRTGDDDHADEAEQQLNPARAGGNVLSTRWPHVKRNSGTCGTQIPSGRPGAEDRHRSRATNASQGVSPPDARRLRRRGNCWCRPAVRCHPLHSREMTSLSRSPPEKRQSC